MNRLMALCAGSTLCALGSVPVAAEASREVARPVLDEVIVTAQRREQSLQETPISLIAFSSGRLEREGISNLGDIASSVPSLTMEPFSTNNTTLRIFIRGVGLADAQITQDPAVGVYMDGVYIARAIGLALDVAELERIEVLRGPQGTLYGRNATGGAINLVTSRPDPDQLAFGQHLTVGNRGLFTSRTRLNIPLSENLAAKLAYMNSHQDGFVKNDGPGKDFGDRQVEGYRLDLRWNIGDRLRLDYAYDRSEIDFVNYTYQPVRPSDTTPASNSPADIFSAQLAEQSQAFVEYSNQRRSRMTTPVPLESSLVEVEGHMASLEWDVSDNLQIKYLVALRELSDLSYVDLSGGSSSPDYRIDSNTYISRDGSMVVPRVKSPMEQKQWSHELQFSGSLNERVQYLAGLYYFEERAEIDSSRSHELTSPIDVIDAPNTVTTVYAVQITGANASIVDNEALAAFGRLTWTPPVFDDRLQLTVGARHSKDRRRVNRINREPGLTLIETETLIKATGATVATAPNVINTSGFSAKGNNRYSDTSMEMIAEYSPRDQFNVYARYSEAYKSGGFNIREPDEAIFSQGFDKEKVVSYELGIKGEWWDRRLRVNGNVFFSEYDNMQLNFKIPGGISDSRVVNAGEAEMRGLELEIGLLAAPDLLLSFDYAYLDARVKKARDPVTGEDASDEFTFNSAPRHSYVAALDWTLGRFNVGRLALNVSYNYMDNRNGSTRRDIAEFIGLPDYGLLNARLGLYDMRLMGGSLTLAAWGKNLTDTEYEINGLAALPHASRAVIWGEPRTYGLDAIFRY